MRGLGDLGRGRAVRLSRGNSMSSMPGEGDRGEEEWRGRQCSSDDVTEIYLTTRNKDQQHATHLDLGNKDTRDTGRHIQLLDRMLKGAVIENIFHLVIWPKNPPAFIAARHRGCSTSDKTHNGKTILSPCITSLKVGNG